MQVIRLLALILTGASATFTLSARAGTLQEDFSTDPAARDWRVFGDTNLFSWDAANQQLQVTWDSSQPNSYFYHPLGTTLSRNDDFSLAFDLRLADITPGVNTNKSGGFELAVGLLNFSEATLTNFLRGTGTDSPDLVEFDFFPDTGFGPTLWPTIISTNSAYSYNGPGDFTK